jgi:hypothetical protein
MGGSVAAHGGGYEDDVGQASLFSPWPGSTRPSSLAIAKAVTMAASQAAMMARISARRAMTALL